jgi:agmatine deiminase
MITATHTKIVSLSRLMEEKVPRLLQNITELLQRHCVPVILLDGTRDIWCRDYMPVWVSRNDCVQFVFDPKYYKTNKYRSWRTDPVFITDLLGIRPLFCGIVLDGGNIVNSEDIAIVTDRVFEDNPTIPEEVILDTLTDLLAVKKVLVVPQLSSDLTGHIDGMVRFVNRETVVLSDFSGIIAQKLFRQIQMCLHDAGLKVILVPNEFHLNKSYDDATGDYINFMEVDNLVVIPGYSRPMDRLVMEIYQGLFPDRNIEQIDISTLTVLGGGLNCVSWGCPY